MKNLFWILLGVFFGILFCLGMFGVMAHCEAYTYLGNPDMAEGGRDFATYGIDVFPDKISLYTNWYMVWIPQEPVTDSYWAKPYADLFIYQTAGMVGVPLIDHNGLSAGAQYLVSLYQTSRGYPNWMLDGTLLTPALGPITVSVLSGSPDWRVDIPLLTDPSWGYLWGTSECSNSVVQGYPTTEPSALILLAVGMVGLMIWLRPVSNIT
jgi:hypothetical protein